MDILGVQVPLWLVFVSVILFAYYKYMTKYFDTFKNIPGLRGPKPLPVLGNMLPVLRNGFADYDKKLIAKYGKVVPFFMGRMPCLLVGDADMVKEILVKRFNDFNDRIPFSLPQPFSEILPLTKGEQWKKIRSVTSLAYSAEKLKRLDQPMNKCCKQLVKNLRAEVQKPVDVKEIIGAFTTDTIAATAFGLEIDSYIDRNNQFVKMITKSFAGDVFNPWIFFSMYAPFIAKLFKLSVMPPDATKFFEKTIEGIIASRKQSDSTKADLIQQLIDSSKDNAASKNKHTLTHSEIIAQSILFFLGGFETLANTCSKILFVLATHAEVQDKLFKEITTTLKADENPGYDHFIYNLKYLDMVLNETMRLYPSLARTDRLTKHDVTIRGVFIPAGTVIQIPMVYIHHNPEIYPDPEKFDPDRFSEEANAGREHVFFQPFGMGPRHCVAKRLGQMVMKMAIVHVVRNFKVLVCEETTIPLKQTAHFRRPDGLKLKFEERP